MFSSISFFFFFNIYLFLTVLGLCCLGGFSLVAASRGYTLVVVHRLLIAVASLCCRARALGCAGSVVVVVPGL